MATPPQVELIVDKSVNTIRFLAIDAVEKAKSGHAGLPMGCAAMGHILYDEVMHYNPKNLYWFNRDRFVLSAGHGCMLQYALMHLAGYDSVKMEGIGNEACSLAGHWGLGKLIALYDDNHICTDGHTDITFTECVATRFEALGWHVVWVKNGNNGYDEIRAALKDAKACKDKPTLIKITTTIGFGSPNMSNTCNVHSGVLGAKEVDATRNNLAWPHHPFHIPQDVKRHWSCHIPNGAALEAEWKLRFGEYEKKYKQEAAVLNSIILGELPVGWDKALSTYTSEIATDTPRSVSHKNLNALAMVLPGLLGGSADLTTSNMSLLNISGDFQKATPQGRNLRFGIREHGMGGICNGIALHSPGLIPYCATFFVFTDYMRGAMRMSALSGAAVIYIMTHDSMCLGQEGPTHQPIEHLASFRAMPNILTLRPADGNETAGAYKVAVLNRKKPSLLVLSRENLPNLLGTSIDGVSKEGYIVSDNDHSTAQPDVILIGTGSDLHIAAKAADQLRKEEKKRVRVVSLVCWELFDEQSDEYKQSVLPEGVSARVSIEGGSTFGWHKFVGNKGKAIGIDHFGACAPAPKLYKEFGFTTQAVVDAAKQLLINSHP